MTAHTPNRRRLLQLIGATGAATLAGCVSGFSGSSEGGNDGWPPNRGIVSCLSPSQPGATRYTLPSIWLGVAEQYYPDDITTTVSTRPGAQGMVALNAMNDSTPDGGTLGATRALSATTLQISSDEANFNIPDIRWVLKMLSDTRAIQISHHSTPVEDHFQWSWDDIVEYAQNEGMKWGISTPAIRLFGNLLLAWEDRLTKGEDIEFVLMPGGSQTRAAVMRGDIDAYLGGYQSNAAARNKFYKTQFVAANPETQPDFVESLQSVEIEDSPDTDIPDSAFVINTSFPTDRAKQLVDIVSDHMVLGLPPKTSDEAYDTHAEAFSQAAEDSETKSQVETSFSPQAFNPLTGQDVQDLVTNKYSAIADDEEVRGIVEEVFQ